MLMPTPTTSRAALRSGHAIPASKQIIPSHSAHKHLHFGQTRRSRDNALAFIIWFIFHDISFGSIARFVGH